ncbi:C6 transcription factor GliZ [Microdochium nivale]|nr:C6 transcription factor GliZ [Microdochium nivale]
MAPPSNGAPITGRRQSCDRCHGQKLRCVRDAKSDIGACVRCLRQEAQCAYSVSLPKGRPSMYRWADNLGGLKSKTASTASKLPESGSDTSSEKKPRSKPSSDSGSATESTVAGSSIGRPSSTSQSNSSSSSSGDEPNIELDVHVPYLDPRPHTGSIIPETIEEGNVMNDPLLTATDPFGPSWVDPNPWSTSFLIGELDQTPYLDFSSMLDDSMDLNIFCQDADLDCFNHHPHQYQPRWPERSASFHSTSASSPTDLESSHMCIAQLSQLTTRLSQLYRSNQSLNDPASKSNRRFSLGNEGYGRSPLVDDGVFKLVSACLADMSTTRMNPRTSLDQPTPLVGADDLGGVLCGVFTASGDLLEILRNLNPPTEPRANTLSNNGNGAESMSLPTMTMRSAPMDGPMEGVSTDPSTSRPHHQEHHHHARAASSVSSLHSQAASNSHVISHLLMACHTMLLTIFDFVLIALERDAELCGQQTSPSPASASPADMLLASSLGSSSSSTAGGGGGGIGAPLSDIRLVMVVQLCSYLVSRQHQFVTAYLPSSASSSSISPTTGALVDVICAGAGAVAPAVAADGLYQDPLSMKTNNEKSVSQLMSDVQSRISRLLRTLGV